MRSRTDAAPSFVFAAAIPAAGEEIAFTGDEAHYLARVVRVRADEHVTVTDGRGSRAGVRVTEVGRAIRGRVERIEQVPPPPALVLACGPPEGERADWLVEKLAEFGVAALQPLECERGGWPRLEGRRSRWERLVRAAMRQSQACHEMELRSPRPFAAWLAALPPGRRWLADPGGAAPGEPAPAEAEAAVVAVGGSGGFSADELKAMQGMDFQTIRLASSRLRTETAALAVAAWWARGREPRRAG